MKKILITTEKTEVENVVTELKGKVEIENVLEKVGIIIGHTTLELEELRKIPGIKSVDYNCAVYGFNE